MATDPGSSARGRRDLIDSRRSFSSQPGNTLPSFVSPQKSAEELVSGTVGSLSSQSSTQTIQANMQDESEKELGGNSTAQISDESTPGTTVSGMVKAPDKAWIE